MKTYLISALLLTVISSSAFGSDRKLREWLDSGSWSQGVEYCNRQLFTELSRRPDRLRTSAESLSRLATYCAALAGGKGDEFSSGWWWYTAASLDLKAAESLLPDLRKLGLLQTLPAPRSRVSSEVRETKKEAEVQLLSGEIVPGVPPRLVIQPRPPDYLFRLARGVGRTKVTIELVVTRDGLPRQPLLVNAQALPIHVLFAYHLLSTWRFEPAKVNDEPVEAVYVLSINTQGE